MTARPCGKLAERVSENFGIFLFLSRADGRNSVRIRRMFLAELVPLSLFGDDVQKDGLRFQKRLRLRQRVDHFLRVVAVSDAEIGEAEAFEQAVFSVSPPSFSCVRISCIPPTVGEIDMPLSLRMMRIFVSRMRRLLSASYTRPLLKEPSPIKAITS